MRSPSNSKFRQPVMRRMKSLTSVVMMERNCCRSTFREPDQSHLDLRQAYRS